MTDCFVFTLTIIWRVYWLYSNYLQHEPVLHKDTTSIRSSQLSLIHYLPPKLPLVFSLPVEQGLGRAIKWQKEEGGSRERGAGRGCASVRGNKWNSVRSKDLWRFVPVTSVRKVLVFIVFFEMKEWKKEKNFTAGPQSDEPVEGRRQTCTCSISQLPPHFENKRVQLKIGGGIKKGKKWTKDSLQWYKKRNNNNIHRNIMTTNG